MAQKTDEILSYRNQKRIFFLMQANQAFQDFKYEPSPASVE